MRKGRQAPSDLRCRAGHGRWELSRIFLCRPALFFSATPSLLSRGSPRATSATDLFSGTPGLPITGYALTSQGGPTPSPNPHPTPRCQALQDGGPGIILGPSVNQSQPEVTPEPSSLGGAYWGDATPGGPSDPLVPRQFLFNKAWLCSASAWSASPHCPRLPGHYGSQTQEYQSGSPAASLNCFQPQQLSRVL